jgi:predicted dehydrogenase
VLLREVFGAMKVGIVGLGYRLGYVATVFRAVMPEFTVVAHVDEEPAGLATMEESGVSAGTRYASLEAMLDQGGLDLLMVGSPNLFHFEHIRIGLERGLRVFTEKPVVATEAETIALAKLIATHGSDRVMVGLVLRYSPLYVALREAQAQGMLGSVVSIEASEHIQPYHGAFFMRDWRRYERLSGGFMLEKCCHDLDLYNGVVGSRPRMVASFGGRKSFIPAHAPASAGINDMEVYHRKPSGWMGIDKVFDSDADIVDYQTAMVEYENGVAMSFHCNMNVPDQFRRFCIVGSHGMAEGDFIRNFLWVHEARTGRKLVDTSFDVSGLSKHYGADERMARDIAAHLRGDAALPVSVTEALEAGLLAMAMDQARHGTKMVDMRATWGRFDAALQGEMAAA